MRKPISPPAIRVAVVDPSPQDYGELLASAGAPGVSLHFFAGGNDALRFARRCQAGLWVVNSRLGGMSGFDLAEMLRSMRPSALVFIIGDEYNLDDEMQTLTLGLAKYICKPLEPAWILPHNRESCIPMLAFRDAGSTAFGGAGPALRLVSTRDSEAADAALDLIPLPERERSVAEQVILPFNPNLGHRPAA